MTLLGLLLRRSRSVVVVSILAGVASGLGGVALIALIHVEMERSGVPSSRIGLAFGGLCLFAAVAWTLSQAAIARLGQDCVATLGLHLGTKILGLPLAEFEEADASGLLAVLTEDIARIANALVGLPLICINGPIVVACLGYVGWLSPPVLAFGIVFAAPAIVGYLMIAKHGQRHFHAARESQDALTRDYRALLDGFRELKIHRVRREAFLGECLRHDAEAVRDRSSAALTTFAVAAGWSQLVFFGFLGVLLFIVPTVWAVDRSTLAGVVLVVLYIMTPLEILVTWVPVLGRARASLVKLERLIPSLEATGLELADAAPLMPVAFREEIRLEAVTYTYRREPSDEGFVLGPADLVLRPGEIVILAGGNGSGKTTLVKLLTGLYSPDSGVIRVDGRPVLEPDRESYRQLFSIVFADGYLFARLLGLSAVTLDDRAQAGLARVGLDRSVSVRDGSFSTIDLSQGQKRRLALLTALLEDRPVYVFDEWAANQDPRFKDLFYQELLPELRAAGKALLVISHDEDDFGIADRVVRLHHGVVFESDRVEQGEGRAEWLT